jgi:hypothetical protein
VKQRRPRKEFLEKFTETGHGTVWQMPDGRVFQTVLIVRRGREYLLRRDPVTRRWVRGA